MVYMAEAVLLVQETFGRLNDFDPGALLEALGDVETIGEGAEVLGLIAVLDEEQQEPMRQFLTKIPPAIDVAIIAVLRSALERGLRTGFSWQPGYDFELRVWDVSKEGRGMVNLHLVSPHPEEAEPVSF